MELLVGVAILGILGALSGLAYSNAVNSAKMTEEILGARQLMTAYHLYPAENNGQLLRGYDENTATAKDHRKKTVTFPASARYLWRLAPYLDYHLEGVTHLGNQRKLAEDMSNTYALSVGTSFGINAVWVGGHYGSGSDLTPTPIMFGAFGAFCVQRMNQAVNPSRLIVFASARSASTGEMNEGYYELKSPNLVAPRWSATYREEGAPNDFGFVHLRHKRKAVVANLDGSVEALNETELKDMTRWSNLAAEAGDPDWTLTRQ